MGDAGLTAGSGSFEVASTMVVDSLVSRRWEVVSTEGATRESATRGEPASVIELRDALSALEERSAVCSFLCGQFQS